MRTSIKYISSLFFMISLLVPLSQAEDFEINVKRLEKNLFQLEDKPILIQTQNCDTLDAHQEPFLKINDRAKTIHFRKSEGKCLVTAAYKRNANGRGSYSVIIQHEARDWYGIRDTDAYIRTKQCRSLAQDEKAVLSLSGTHGVLIVNQLECPVEGVYTKIE